MTRDFNKQRRDDTRPSSRHTSPGNYREERPFKPARPRLSRNAVDRAWENGATPKYADYQPRQNASRPPFQQQGRPAPRSEQYRSPQGRSDYNPRQENYRRPDPPHASYQRRTEGSESSRRPFNESEYRRFSSTPHSDYQQRYEQRPGERRFNGPGHRAPDGQPGYNSERWTRDQRGPAQPYRDNAGRYQDSRPPHFEQRGPGTPARNNYRSADGPRDFTRGGYRERGNFARDNRTGDHQERRDNYNPRWQSRPAAQRGYPSSQRDYPSAPRERSYDRPAAEQFEGDYERFDAHQDAESVEQLKRTQEKHVTRLPDGRVLKGSRPAQRKQARFWNGVEEEASTLMSHTPTPETTAQEPEPITPDEPAAKPAELRKPRATAKPKAVRTVKTNYDRGTGGMKSLHGSKAKALKKRTQGPAGPGTRPSQRGYKWPTSGESGE